MIPYLFSSSTFPRFLSDFQFPFGNLIPEEFATRNFPSNQSNTVNREPVGFSKFGLGLSRGHNVFEIKDEKGNVTKYVYEIEHTPYPKESVKVYIEDGAICVHLVSPEKKESDTTKNVLYSGIYSDEQFIRLDLPGDNIALDKISAVCKDGIVRIEIPVVPEKKAKRIDIKVG